MTAGVATTVEKMLEPTKEIVITWTSGDVANGNATVTTTNVFTGQILRVVTVPGTGGENGASVEADVELLPAEQQAILLAATRGNDGI